MSVESNTVFIIEDDQAVRDALGLLLGLRGLPVALFADAESFLGAYQATWRGCLLIDIRMPGMDGLVLQKRLLELGCEIPAVLMTAHGDVSSARDAFRARAIEFLEKPIDHARLLAAIDEAFQYQAQRHSEQSQRTQRQRLMENLTGREAEVLELVVTGKHNREIAADLGISPRTVEVHKARIMHKLNVRTVAELVRLSLQPMD